jgi:membrane protein DedA with SNARE-associated domain
MTFDQILQFVTSQNEFLIYAILTASAITESLFPPFPGDSITLAGAYLAGKGDIDYIGVLISTVLGGLIGTMALYYLGRSRGRELFEKGTGKYFGKGSLIKIEKMFARFGDSIIIVSRFMPGIRSAVALTAGIGNINIYRMTAFSAISIILWNCLLIGLMIYAKSDWRAIIRLVREYNTAFILILILLLTAWIFRIAWLRIKSSK